MAVFTPKSWIEDDPITPAELNRMEDGIARLPGTVYTFGTGRSNADLPTGWSTSTDNGTRVTHNLGHTNYVAVVTPRPSPSAALEPHMATVFISSDWFRVRHLSLVTGEWVHVGLGFECIVIDLGAP